MPPRNKNKKGKGKKKPQQPMMASSQEISAPGSKRGASDDVRTALHDETGPALQHEDEFGDDFEQEDIIYNEEDDEDNDGLIMEDDEDEAPVRVFRPGIDQLEEGEELTFDPSAYVMHHALRPEWPSLSFDFVRDELGGNRSRFPLSMFAVAGSQAASQDANKLTLMKFTDLHKMKNNRDSEDMGDSEAMINLDGDDDDEVKDPVLDSIDIAHPAGINRVRSCPQQPGIVATFGDDSKVRVFDLSAHLASLCGNGPRPGWSGPCFTFEGHQTEGYALDWSPAGQGQLATGDCAGKIHIWQPLEGGGSWAVEPTGRAEHTDSVEDIQWSPSESTVFISCSVDQSIKVWDVREPRRSMVSAANTHPCDINVLSWNPSVAYLLASGADDGCFKIWDLRSFGGVASEPVANFRWHSKPITSIEWHPTDESVVAVASDDDSISFWDMSVEEDTETDPSKPADKLDVPPQLLFVHQGQQSIKELHFHPQVPGVVMSTALDGYNIFKPNTNI